MLYIYGNIYIRITPCRVSLFWALHWAHFCFLQQWPARSIVHVPHIAPHKGASVGLYFVALAVSWLTLIPQSSDSVTGFWSVKCCPLVPHCQVNLIALWLLYKSVDAILATGWVKTGQCSTHGPTFHIFRWPVGAAVVQEGVSIVILASGEKDRSHSERSAKHFCSMSYFWSYI